MSEERAGAGDELTDPVSDLRGRLVAAFLGGVRSAAAQHADFGWTRAYAEQQYALCDRIEQLGPRGAYLGVMLCCAGAKVDLTTAVETVEAVCQEPA